MEQKIFDRLRTIIYQKSGITLSEGKKVLLTSRIQKRLKALQLDTHKEYLKFLEEDLSGHELVNMLNVVSTNVTSFFRDMHHFTAIEKHMSNLIKKDIKKLKIWCAASSSGQEPYSIAISMKKSLPSYVEKKILATDISTDILNKAKQGIYKKKEIEPIDRSSLLSYFTKVKKDNTEMYHVKDELKSMILFKRLNLSEELPLKGPLDIIFCRNVMIYFDTAVKNKLIAQIEKLLTPGGLLILGSTESLTGLKHGLDVYQPSIYIKK